MVISAVDVVVKAVKTGGVLAALSEAVGMKMEPIASTKGRDGRRERNCKEVKFKENYSESRRNHGFLWIPGTVSVLLGACL